MTPDQVCGPSAERDVSLSSGLRIAVGLRARGHDVTCLDPVEGVLTREKETRLAGVGRRIGARLSGERTEFGWCRKRWDGRKYQRRESGASGHDGLTPGVAFFDRSSATDCGRPRAHWPQWGQGGSGRLRKICCFSSSDIKAAPINHRFV